MLSKSMNFSIVRVGYFVGFDEPFMKASTMGVLLPTRYKYKTLSCLNIDQCVERPIKA